MVSGPTGPIRVPLMKIVLLVIIGSFLLLTLLGVCFFVGVTVILPRFAGGGLEKRVKVKDPNGPTVVTLDIEKPKDGKIYWNCTISANGTTGNQHTGWPPNLINTSDHPESITWGQVADSVEITFKSGAKVRLHLDNNAVLEARKSTDFNFYIPHSFERLAN